LKFRPFPWLVNGVTLFLGKISYSLYLSQYAAINILQKTGLFSFFPQKAGPYAYVNTAINLLMLFLITVVLSFILYHTIEFPFQNIGKKFLQKKILYAEASTEITWGNVRAIFRKTQTQA
jgi:peptidoglycan/LPS O-acetylase OafA/YrhL